MTKRHVDLTELIIIYFYSFPSISPPLFSSLLFSSLPLSPSLYLFRYLFILFHFQLSIGNFIEQIQKKQFIQRDPRLKQYRIHSFGFFISSFYSLYLYSKSFNSTQFNSAQLNST
ncbi:hypothetical protein EYC80_006602 [Monilinia laxa]|uniref:Uncharacterized protein n=1 Tax=Monilinia laxa TaxID=61186 RepID=A0A5N6JTW1_MONLA|nr:hypothetical protein EYC80_006602 [Monilinia laxa]